ncbi:hypothetical protein M0805_000872 [Coniferiporia weirii]|nr:hypothetical protein M0805_000872 [Coniferiporia weirii]
MSEQLLDTPAKHPFSITGLADKAWQRIQEGAFRTALMVPAARLAEAAVVSVLQNMTEGQLRIVSPSTTYTFPDKPYDEHSDLKAELRVLRDAFWIRLCTMGDLGFAEAYMYGEVECDDLLSTFSIFLRNRARLQNLDSRLSYLFSLPQKLTSTRFLNTLSNSRSNISAHYDISNKMFAGFLSEDMTYSCAIFENLDGDLQRPFPTQISTEKCVTRTGLPTPTPTPTNEPLADAPDELYEAQLRKLDHIIQRARIAPGQRVLEIGSGWGSMAVRIASRFPGTTVDTLTLSVHQQALALARIAEAGADVAERVSVHLLDYRAMPAEWAGRFDRVVSIEMVEAVGLEFLEEYWRVIDWALKPDVGVGVVQGITIPEARFERYVNEVDFIQKWTLASGSQGRLVVDSVSNIGPHYARTLREWKRRFIAHFDDVVEPALREEYPDVMAGENGRSEIEVFKRKWIYYYSYCEIGFTTRSLGDHIITFTREGNASFGCSVFD